MHEEHQELPAGVLRALDGERLDDEIGRTLLVIAVGEDGWPRPATLSVGEVYAPDPSQVLLSLYSTSRTTAAIRRTGRALLLVDDAGGIVRVRLATTELAGDGSGDPGRATFRGRVEQVERDSVPYARVTSGIRFELLDPEAALARWRRQLDELKALA